MTPARPFWQRESHGLIARNILRGALVLATLSFAEKPIVSPDPASWLDRTAPVVAFTTLAVRSDKDDTLSGRLVPTPGSFMITPMEMTLATSLRADMA